MKLSRTTIEELGVILKKNYNFELPYSDLEKFAYSLVGFFELLVKAENRHKFGNDKSSLIDNEEKEKEDDIDAH